MTKANLKQFCHIDHNGTAELKDDVVMTYKGEMVLQLDFDNNYVITMQGLEHVGEYEMKTSRLWNKVRVFKEVK